MKVLSLLQPRASACITQHPEFNKALKTWETRSWKPSPTVYEQLKKEGLLIHASLGWKPDQAALMKELPFRQYSGFLQPMPRGVIIGYVTVGMILKTEDWGPHTASYMDSRAWQEEKAMGDYSQGRYAWEFKSFKVLTPIPCKGSLSLWDCPLEILQKLF